MKLVTGGYQVVRPVPGAEGINYEKPLSRIFHVKQSADEFCEIANRHLDATTLKARVKSVQKRDTLGRAGHGQIEA